jgi:hypothetical protein
MKKTTIRELVERTCKSVGDDPTTIDCIWQDGLWPHANEPLARGGIDDLRDRLDRIAGDLVAADEEERLVFLERMKGFREGEAR